MPFFTSKTEQTTEVAPAFYILTLCPSTGRLTEKDEGIPFPIPDGEAVWWHCSACGGWHTSITDCETTE